MCKHTLNFSLYTLTVLGSHGWLHKVSHVCKTSTDMEETQVNVLIGRIVSDQNEINN